jgi:hypothetical protein
MKLSKKLLTITAAGALCAAAATPALAFDNEFHGSYLMKYFITNYEAVTNDYILDKDMISGKNKQEVTSRKVSNYFDTRARFYYTAKASDDLKLVTGFEIDSVFGDNSQKDGRNQGAALEADETNLETKWMYLDFKIPSTPVKVMGGIMPVKDKFKGVFFDADVAGINTVTKYGPATVSIGYFRAYDESLFSTASSTTDDNTKGMHNLDIVAASLDYNVNKNLRAGLAYYLYSDNRDKTYNTTTGAITSDVHAPTKIHTFGLNADGKVEKLTLSGFAAMQLGSKDGAKKGTEGSTFYGYAFNAAAKYPVGPGNARTAFLYTSGDDGKGSNSAWQAVNQSGNAPNTGTSGNSKMTNSYNESGMMLLNRNLAAGGTTTDYHIVQGTGNLDQGVILLTAGYDATITPKWYANGNLGAAWVSRTNEDTRATTKGCNFLGTEINVETGYKLYDNLTASVQAAYVFLGGYYTDSINGKDPKDPFTTRLALNYAF